jgi:hypothetical protein
MTVMVRIPNGPAGDVPPARRGLITAARRPDNPHPTPQIRIGELKAVSPKIAKMYAGADDNEVLPLTAHHIIPWNRIRDFWNFMMVNELYNSAEAFLWLVDKTWRAPRWIREIKQGELAAVEFDQMTQSLCWAEGNLVWGPSKRADDPLDQVDDMSVGAAGPEKERIARMVRIGHQMKGFIDRYPGSPSQVSGPDGLRWERGPSAVDSQVRAAVRGWQGAYANKKIVEFDPNMWSIMSSSQAYTPSDKFTRSPVTHPKWFLNKSTS